MQHSSSALLSQIKLYKAKITLQSTQLQNFLQYLDEVVFKKTFFFCSPGRASVAPSFARAYHTLTPNQQQDYYLACLKIVYEQNSQRDTFSSKDIIQKVEAHYRLEDKQWRKTNVVIHNNNAVLQIELTGVKINLENYILRSSKTKDKFAFVLESCKAESEPLTVRLGFGTKEAYQQFITKIKVVVMGGLRKKIAKMMRPPRESLDFVDNWLQQRQSFPLELQRLSVRQPHTSLKSTYNSSKSIQISVTREDAKASILQFLLSNRLIEGLASFNDYRIVSQGFFAHRTSAKARKISRFEANCIGQEEVIAALNSPQTAKKWKKSLRGISEISQLESSDVKFFHQRNCYKDGNVVDYVYVRVPLHRDGCVYLVDKSTPTADREPFEALGSRGNIEYCLWRISQDDDLIEVLVEAEINSIPSQDIYQAINEQLGELQNLPLCVRAKGNGSQKIGKPCDSFFSVAQQPFQVSPRQPMKGNPQDLEQPDPSESQFFSINPDSGKRISQISESEILSLGRELNNLRSSSMQHLESIYRYQTTPEVVGKRRFKQFKKGSFFDEEECVVNEAGDLVFTNQAKIRAQGGVIKSVIKKMGMNLFSGKGILNVSFPIQIFAADTNIQRLCRAMAYAPHFLQNKSTASPLERMKAAICFAIGNLLLYIDMAKPFNPILGETYQGFIDGCPVYGEQTSHHPPVSSLFLIGRDFSVSGNIEATVSLGINSVSGTNDGEYRIWFGPSSLTRNTIIYTSPPGQLSGVLYGQRKLNITDKSRFFDPENHLYCEIHWGKRKTKNPVSRFHDYLEGKIVQLNKPATKISKVKQSDKDAVLGYITGRWTDTIYFDGEPIFEINKLRPFAVTDERLPLRSDSGLRMDRVNVEAGKIGEAQAAKDQLQEIQRRDRKLREKYRK